MTGGDESAPFEPRSGVWPVEDGGPEAPQPLHRLVTFSDAIFAIAMTLLVIDLRVPAVPPHQLTQALAGEVPAFLSLLLSFAVIGAYWAGQHRLFEYIRIFDRRLIWLDLSFLLGIVLMPFLTALLGAFGQEPLVLILYALDQVYLSAVQVVVWLYATRPARPLGRRLTPAWRIFIAIRSARAGVIFGLSMPVALVDPGLAPLSWILMIPYTMLLDRLWSRRQARAEATAS